ncbi:RNaseH domain-containing protein, partial [Microcoleus sp. AT9_A2]|uniref:RNaseH domain-containing protein n=1 Tax=Microcoleus sp. AT9_A2 TaxID=2818624 RepID=UPI002FCE84EF
SFFNVICLLCKHYNLFLSYFMFKSRYLSVRNEKPGKLRGQSCYRSTKINVAAKKAEDSQDKLLNNADLKVDEAANKSDDSKGKLLNKAKLKVDKIASKPPFLGQWTTPNPLEIVVTLRQENDKPDRLAALVESLRYGFGHYSDWSSLPATLFFERVVRDYISEFAIEDEERSAEPDREE